MPSWRKRSADQSNEYDNIGVDNLENATRFYTSVLDTAANTAYQGVVFFELPGTWLALYPRDALAREISPEIQCSSDGFSGVTLAHNASSREEVIAILERAQSLGATVQREATETFWGGFSGLFTDLDTWTATAGKLPGGPMFDFTASGDLCFKG